VVTFNNLPKGAVSRSYAMEITKGFTAAIDLRPDPGALASRLTGSISVTPTEATENGGRESVGNDRAAARRDR
jgi:hypothetical protein